MKPFTFRTAFKLWVFALALNGLLCFLSKVYAAPVRVEYTNYGTLNPPVIYNIDTAFGSYDELEPLLTSQPWWHNPFLAASLPDEYIAARDAPLPEPLEDWSPLFLFGFLYEYPSACIDDPNNLCSYKSHHDVGVFDSPAGRTDRTSWAVIAHTTKEGPPIEVPEIDTDDKVGIWIAGIIVGLCVILLRRPQ